MGVFGVFKLYNCMLLVWIVVKMLGVLSLWLIMYLEFLMF